MALIFPLQGSHPSDFDSDVEHHNDIEPCPDSPNCVLVSRSYSQSREDIFNTVSDVLKNMEPNQLSIMSEQYRVESVYKIPLFGFKDDLHILVDTTSEGSTLHIRSASRVGYSDLGVNRRRVKEILSKVEEAL